MAVDVAQLLAFAVKNNASDLHLSAGVPPMIRVDGDMKRINMPALSHKEVHGMVYDIMNDKQRKAYEEFFETDFSFEIPKLARFRVNAFNQNRGAGAVFRTIPSEVLTLEDLGCPRIFKELIEQPQGLILVTGPTGSGKSTTLYATLGELNATEKNIVTVEDPVEYRMRGINQVQVNPRIGLTFHAGLRSILRSDPDVVMIGEIRDRETAKTSVEAALTGHLVLATLHTNNAPAAVTRLTDMGVEPFLTASAVDCVIAQRLARRLCDRCKRPADVDEKAIRELGPDGRRSAGAKSNFHAAVGCERCSGTGYAGRIGVYEIMLVDEQLRRLILRGASADEIDAAARKAGMVPLREDGLTKAAQGITTVEEVLLTVL
jgi:type IV pilus assembly protein PilB